mgnify:CR=1 FL=1
MEATMQLTSDVLVIGAGIAGLTAALAAAQQGCSVKLVGAGSGSYAISSGCIDLLGQIKGNLIQDPWSALPTLDAKHPYRLLGEETIKCALNFFQTCLQNQGSTFHIAQDAAGNSVNTLVPTILGTFKPSYLIPDTLDAEPLFAAKKILVCGVQGLRDMSPRLIQENFEKNPRMQGKVLDITSLPPPQVHPPRSLSALDLARFVNTKDGYTWLSTSLGRYRNTYDCILLPPICGTEHASTIIEDLRTLLCTHVEEILCIPPGVGGLRMHDLLVNEANKEHVQCIENARINEADVSQKICRKVVAKHASSEITFLAKAFVLATGGIYGGGIDLTPNQCTEKIFSLPIVVQPTELTESDIFAEHNFSKIGVVVNERLCPQNPRGETVLENVFLAGKILAGFDQSAEKSGHGVAIATGYQAGILAGNYAQEATRRA